MPIKQIADLRAAQGLVFEQPLSEYLQIVLAISKDPSRLRKACLDQPSNLGVDLLRRFL